MLCNCKMFTKLSTSIIFGATLCVISILFYLDMYISDPIFESSITPIHYIYKSSGKKRYHKLHSVNLHRNLLIQIDQGQDYSRSLTPTNTTCKYLKQPRRKLNLQENHDNSSENIALNKLVPEQKAENSTPVDDLVFDYEYTYDYASESASSQEHFNGNSWLYRVAPDQPHQIRQHRVAQQPKETPDDSVFEDWKELEEIAKKTVQKDKNTKTMDQKKNSSSLNVAKNLNDTGGRIAQTQKYSSKRTRNVSLVHRTSNLKRSQLKQDVENNNVHSDDFINKLVFFMSPNNLSKTQLKAKPKKLSSASRNSSKGIDVNTNVYFLLPKPAAINVTKVKQGYNKANRTDIPEELYRLAPDLFDQIPPPKEFLTEFKSPCWHRKSDKRLLCLPYFYLAGMPKCGTTDMWAKINSHKGVYGTWKEPHWWARRRIGRIDFSRKSNGNSTMTFQDYVNRYAGMADGVRLSSSKAYMIAGDGSASTLWDNHAWDTYYPEYYHDGPPYVTGDIIHAITPRARILILLRNPVDRLYSSYRYFYKDRKPSPNKFHEQVENGISNYKQCLQNRSFRACVYSLSGDFRKDKVGLARGFYNVFIQDWFKSFPKDQLMVIRLEDWSKDCTSILPQIFEFLKSAPLKPSSISTLCTLKRARNPGPTTGGKMLAKTRIMLKKFYMPHLLNLAEILGDGKFLW